MLLGTKLGSLEKPVCSFWATNPSLQAPIIFFKDDQMSTSVLSTYSTIYLCEKPHLRNGLIWISRTLSRSVCLYPKLFLDQKASNVALNLGTTQQGLGYTCLTGWTENKPRIKAWNSVCPSLGGLSLENNILHPTNSISSERMLFSWWEHVSKSQLS